MDFRLLGKHTASVGHHSSFFFWINFSEIEGASFGDLFEDIGESFSNLPRSVFPCLLCIHPVHLLYRSGNHWELDTYLLSCFARQFGYDQLHVGSPNAALAFEGSLVDGGTSLATIL